MCTHWISEKDRPAEPAVELGDEAGPLLDALAGHGFALMGRHVA
ncbi:hypothetical protein [Neorhizobium sp. P12A]|nr:hypothetical protein [Neorhizobium sp. P12A]